MIPCSTCKYDETRGSSINMCEVCLDAEQYTPITDKTKEEYTQYQLNRIQANLQAIKDMTMGTPLDLDLNDIDFIYTMANDSMCRIEGITHYPPKEEE